MISKIKGKLKKHIPLLKSVSETSYYCHFLYRAKIKKNTVLFESRNGAELASNIFYLIKEMQSGNYGVKKVYLTFTRLSEKKIKKLLERYNISGVILVRQCSREYYKLLATVNYIFTDVSLPRAYVKKEGQIIVNTWHGTPLKKMGKYFSNARSTIGNIQRFHFFADYLLYPNDYMKEKMLKAHDIETIYSGEILCEGYPRNSVFFEENDNEKLRAELSLSGKEVFVYMPTWKAENVGKTMEESLLKMHQSLLKIDALLSENQVMLLKLHPLVKANADVSEFKHIRSFPEDYEPYEVLACCDALITDYSSVFFDFACSHKKIVLFTPDDEGYDAERGTFISFSELPFPNPKTETELIEALNSPISYDDSEFVKKFCTYDRKDAAKYILTHVIKGEKCCKTEHIEKSDKQRVLLYCGGLQQNGITAAFKNLLEMIDLDEKEYFFFIRQSLFNKNLERLDFLPDKVKFYTLSSDISSSFMETVAFVLYYRFNYENKLTRRFIDRAYEREFKKHFTNFDMDYVVNFSGYDKYIIELLKHFDAKKIIFVHSDMEKELATKTNQHGPTLQSGYREYDKVAVVTPAMAEVTARISGKKDNIVVVGNAFNVNLVKAKGEMPIAYENTTRSSIHHLGGIEGILNEKGTKFITVGRFSQEKQHNMLIDAFCEYNEKNPDSYLILIGGAGNLYNKTVAYANSKPCSKNIAFIYSIKNPMPIIKKCDLFILSSKYEAQPIVIFEADALGVPAICTDMKGPADILNRFGGTIVENSKEGILEGIKAFENGEVKTMNIDFEAYNNEALSQFYNLFSK